VCVCQTEADVTGEKNEREAYAQVTATSN